jgi:hypothetical protein
VSAFDDHVHDALNRALDELKSQVETAFTACRDELVRVAADESNRLTAEAMTARAEAEAAAERQLNEWREAAARDAEERDRDIEARERQAEAREHDAEARERESDSQRREAEARQQATERALEEVRRALDEARRQSQHELDQIRANKETNEETLSSGASLPEAIRSLDEAASFGDTLDVLARSASAEAGRAAVFLVKGDRLRDWRTVGFADSSSEMIQSAADAEAPPFADALRGDRGIARGEQLPPFAAGSGPRYAVALPITVGGAVVAILYADGLDADKEIEPAWAARLDVLARYAGRMLESITIRQAAGLSAVRPLKTGSAHASGRPPAGSVQ